MNTQIIFGLSKEKYKNFKKTITEIINALSNFKLNESENYINDLLILEKEDDLFLEHLFFCNYSKWITLNLEFLLVDFKNIIFYIKRIRINNAIFKFAKNIYRIMFYMYIFLASKIESILVYIAQKPIKSNVEEIKIKQLNQSFQILIQIFLIIIRLYKEKIYNLNEILLFFDVLLFYINRKNYIDDKYIRVKKLTFFNLLIDKFFGYLLFFLLNNIDVNKDDLVKFINYVIKILNGKKFKDNFNFQILSKKKIIDGFISNLLNNMDYNNNINIYNEYKDKIVNCFANVYKNNIHQYNFFEILINQNKKSFINLVNYKTRKASVIKDIYIQNFYIELLEKIFSIEKNSISNIITEENYFKFNGNNSKIALELDEFSLNNSFILFSFQLSKDVTNASSKIFPLIYFQSQLEKENIFKLYIKMENDSYKLYIYQEKDKKNKKKCFDKMGNIQINTNYSIVMTFLNKKLGIYINNLNEKNKDFYEESEIYNVEFNIPILKIGYDIENNEYFKGYIGTFIIMKNLEVKKNSNNNFIKNILNLKQLYKFIPLLFSKSTIYNFDEKIFFPSIDDEKEINNIFNFLINDIDNFSCELYLEPEIFGFYHSLFMKNKNNEDYIFPELKDKTLGKKFKIINLNVSIIRKSNIYIEFLRNNGFYYFILVYEYYYNLFKLIESDKNEFDLFLREPNLNKIIIKTINLTLSILHKNYIFFKYIVSYKKQYKTLFRNLYELLKCKSIQIIYGVSNELFQLIFAFKNEVNLFRHNLKKNFKYIDLRNSEEALTNFVDGLMDIICDSEIYLNNHDDNSLNMLFQSLIIIISYYKNKNDIYIDYPLEERLFFKILNFTKVLEIYFTNDYKMKNKTVKTFFDLIKIYLDVNEDKKIKQNCFRKLFLFIIKNFENNLIVVMNFLNFIYEMLFENFYLEFEEIGSLLKFYSNNKLDSCDNNNSELFDEINIIIFNILSKLSFIDNSKTIFENLISNLDYLFNSENRYSNVISQIKNNFIYFFVNNDGKANHMEIFTNIFRFVLELFKLIIKKNEAKINEEKDEIIYNSFGNEKFDKLINLLNNIIEILKVDLKIKRTNKNCLYCLINFLIFYFRLITFEKNVFLYSPQKFTQNLIQVIDLFNKYFLINCMKIFKFKIGSYQYQKSIIEIIYEITVRFFLNDKIPDKCYQLLLNNLDIIFYDQKFKDNQKYSVFFVNDQLNYFLSKKKFGEEKDELIYKCNILDKYNNEYFDKEEKFIGNMVTYFLPIIIESQKAFNDLKLNSSISEFSKFLDKLFSLILEEHSLLYKLNKKYFFKQIISNYQHQLLKFIKENYIKKKISLSIEEIKENIESISEKNKKEYNKLFNSPEEYLFANKENIEEKDFLKDIIIIPTEIPQFDNKITFFYDLDKNYITNVKKEIMNTIFSYYYLDELFYNYDFCIIKKYYLNNYLNCTEQLDSKKLNFPSIIKNYINNFEPPLFLKRFNNYVFNPYFQITHSYINNELLKNKLSMEKSIKLYPKEFQIFEKDLEFECELLKNEDANYGKLYYNDSKNYLLFKEKPNNFSDEEGFEHIFLISNALNYINNKREEMKYFDKKNFYKNILILFDDVEEVIERRILLLWKGFEIYLKNGKSFIFNLLTTKDYNEFYKKILSKSKIKNLIRKRNFLSNKNNITKNWEKYLMTNFEYLLILNRYSSRSYNDSSQYPVFPWLLKDYKDLILFNKNEKNFILIKNEYEKIKIKNTKNKFNDSKDDDEQNENLIEEKTLENEKIFEENILDIINKKDENNKNYYSEYKEYIEKSFAKFKKLLRNFKYPPCAQSEYNKKSLLIRFEGDIELENKFPCHMGSHYSNVGFLYYFLMRGQPYGNYLTKLQGYDLENPNRMFISLASVNEIILRGIDNRELIPEFCSKIEYFLNFNYDLYGYRMDNDLVDDCELDKIINNEKTYLSKYVCFILQHKKLLNSRLIGFYLSKWIDIIFGVGQLPPINKRKESYNIYHKRSYEQMTNLENKLEKYLKNPKNKPNLTNSKIKDKIITKTSKIKIGNQR